MAELAGKIYFHNYVTFKWSERELAKNIINNIIIKTVTDHIVHFRHFDKSTYKRWSEILSFSPKIPHLINFAINYEQRTKKRTDVKKTGIHFLILGNAFVLCCIKKPHKQESVLINNIFIWNVCVSVCMPELVSFQFCSGRLNIIWHCM